MPAVQVENIPALASEDLQIQAFTIFLDMLLH